MSAINDGGPAFPQVQVDFGNGPEYPGPFGMGGMSLRDYFAGQALAALRTEGYGTWADLALDAYDIADAMIATASKGGEA